MLLNYRYFEILQLSITLDFVMETYKFNSAKCLFNFIQFPTIYDSINAPSLNPARFHANPSKDSCYSCCWHVVDSVDLYNAITFFFVDSGITKIHITGHQNNF